MQGLELVAIALIVLGGAAVVGARLAGEDHQSSRRLGIMLGLVAGLLGAGIVLASRFDLIPDEFDAWASPLVVLAISSVALGGTIWRLRR